MKTTFAIVSVLLAIGLIAGIVVPREASPDALAIVSAEQLRPEPPPDRLVSNRSRAVANSMASAGSDADASTSTLTAPEAGAEVPLVDLLGVAGLLGGAAATLLLLQGRNPDGGQRDVRSEAPRHQP